MNQKNILRLLFVILTLPIGILICRGRTIPVPHPVQSQAAIISERLSSIEKKQAKQRDLQSQHDLHRSLHQTAHTSNV
jgi:hypothetical protein